ncbi:D-alanine--D-alanine ligase family protein [Desulfovermiculus halophilus]|jgi:D-alanine-D-alanine ligase|uniref:D-alanine--D-alanine ligase family protein n=1 Tax=Desulfovermiculus halophilus TaxID=339722 RepID=UPI00048A003B|nr:D-alanine--D-alanine ligase [Desulfovermiculus halophilus]
MRILLIAGGWSNERDVSLSGRQAIHTSLERLGHQVVFFDPAVQFHRLPEMARDADFAFINLHGCPGEDGLIQALLDRLGCPYQGSGPSGSLLALNKAAAKELFVGSGIPTPNWEFLPRTPEGGWTCGLRFPLFLKPNNGGSSLDISHVHSQEQLADLLPPLFSKGCEALLEEAVSGQEITCAVLGSTALPPILIQPADSSGFFDYFSKYTPQAAQEICPAPISGELTSLIQDLAVRAHQCLGLSGYSRADFMVRDNQPYLLEVNTLPGMTATSLFPQAAQAVGLSFEQMVAELIELGKNGSSTQ